MRTLSLLPILALSLSLIIPVHAGDLSAARSSDGKPAASISVGLPSEAAPAPRDYLAPPRTFETTAIGDSIIRWYGFYDPVTNAAVEGEVWTFDHGAADPLEGWTSTDRSANDFVAWRFINPQIWDYHNPGAAGQAPIGDPTYPLSGSAWLGLFEDEAESLCWPGGLGYGNRWVQRLESPTLAYETAELNVSYLYFCDLEPYCDYVRVILRFNGDLVDTLATYTGTIGSGDAYEYDALVCDLTDYGDPPWEYSILFEMTSDGSWSDEDSLYSTDLGPFGLDNVVIGGPCFTFDFNLDYFTASTDPPSGAFLAVNPASAYSLTDTSCGIGGSVLSFHDSSHTHPELQMEEGVSPAIPVPGGAGPYNIFVDMDVYQEFYEDAGVVFQVEWGYYPYVDCHGDTVWSSANDNNWVGDATTCADYRAFGTRRGPGTAWVPAGADSVRLHLTVWNSCPGGLPLLGDCSVPSNFSPLFDNIRVGITNPTVWHVPGPGCNTIQAAIDSAASGDTVLVRAGTRSGVGNRGLDFRGKAILVCSEEGPEKTIIDCEGADRGFVFQSGETSASILDGFTVMNGIAPDGWGGGILCLESSPLIRNCFFVENGSSATLGGGAYMEDSAPASPAFEDCIFAANEGSSGGGIYIGFGAGPTFEDCLIAGNSAVVDGGAVFMQELFGVPPHFLGCTISRNKAGSGYPAGIVLLGTGEATLEQCILYGDCGIAAAEVATVDDGIIHFLCSDVDTSRCLGNCTFDANTISVDPGFCAPADCDSVPTSIGDYSLAGDSPCLPGISPCGALIGALGEGCQALAGVPPGEAVPTGFGLSQANPNPFSIGTMVTFNLPEPGHVTLSIHDVRGRLIRELADEVKQADSYSIEWDGRDGSGGEVPAGVYFVRFEAGIYKATGKVVLVR
jgi:hypothetical protein